MSNSLSNSNKWLQVRRVIDVPLREVSGICLRRGQAGRMYIVAVGDHAAKVAWSPRRATTKAASPGIQATLPISRARCFPGVTPRSRLSALMVAVAAPGDASACRTCRSQGTKASRLD
jgi:hypothetical protein